MNKLQSFLRRPSLLVVAFFCFVATVLFAPLAKAVYTPVEVDPADAITQLQASAGDLLPYAIAAAVVMIVFKMVRRVIR